MKKMIFGALALFIGTVAFGQQTDPAPLLGGATETTSNISGDADANVTENYQFGNANKVRVAQAGTRQSVYTSQDNGSGTGENIARIMQTGEVQPESGVENVAEVKQSGSRNGAQIGQQGDENLAVAHQGQFDDGSEDNVAMIQQGTGEQAQYNSAEVYQDGKTNFVGIQQTFDRSSAAAIQGGDDNKSLINQNAGPNLSDGMIAGTAQFGARNEASISQMGTPDGGGDTGRSVAFTDQLGNDNKAKQVQNSTADEGVQGETAYINQGFDTGVGFFLDNDGAANANGETDVYDQLNAIDGDLSVSEAGSFGGEAIQMQTGKMSAAEIHQFGSADSGPNKAQQNQSGWNQEALIVQNSNGHPAGGDNYAFQDQKDDNNTAAIGQNGFSHKAAQFQDGKRNNAFSVQRGQNNLVSTEQYGNDSRLETLQNGSANRIKVVQTDGQSALVEQNAGQFGPGNGGNQANIYQTGSGGDLGLQVETCDFGEMMEFDQITPGTVTVPELCPGCN